MINKTYDELIENIEEMARIHEIAINEIKELKSRTCERCKHWDYKGWCHNIQENCQFPTTIDFGCNKWEKK